MGLETITKSINLGKIYKNKIQKVRATCVALGHFGTQ